MESKIQGEYPEFLAKNRNIVEGNVIGCLWKEPELYGEFKDLKIDDFITDDGRIFYKMGEELYKLGFRVFDKVTLMTYLNNKEELKKEFEKRGGYDSIGSFVEIINIQNAEVFYDELVKDNILRELAKRGFGIKNDYEFLEKMNSKQVYQWYDGVLNNIFIQKQLGINVEDLTVGFEEFLDKCNSGKNMGTVYSKSCPLLSYLTSGLHRKSFVVTSAHSGGGKTSFEVFAHIIPLLEQGEKICVIANEQGISEWRGLLLNSVMSNVNRNFKMNRTRFQVGGFTKEEWEYVNKAKEWLSKYEGNLKFVQLYDYDTETIIKIIKTMSKKGFGFFIYDTAKADNLEESKAWGSFVEQSKKLFQTANKENVCIIATMQLAMSTLNVRYLNGSCIGTAKGVKEVASQMFLMRKLWKDEYKNGKHDVKPYNLHKNPLTNAWEKKYFELNDDKEYVILFLDKNRHGQSDVALIYERNLAFNHWHEIGYCTPSANLY